MKSKSTGKILSLVLAVMLILSQGSVYAYADDPGGEPQYVNAIVNGDFETGAAAPAEIWSYSIVNDAGDVYDGNYSIKITGPAYTTITHSVTGLEPNTEYTASVYIKPVIQDTGKMTFGAKAYADKPASQPWGDTIETFEIITAADNGAYKKFTHTFTTGSGYTSAGIYLCVENAGDIAFADNFELLVEKSSEPSDTYVNAVGNGDFETGTLSPAGGGGASIIDDAADVYAGTYSAKLTGTAYARVEYAITGLKPETQYTLTAWAKTDGTAYVGAKQYSDPSADTSVTVTGNDYAQYSHSFTTGAGFTTAVIYVCNDASASTVSYVDNIELMYIREEVPLIPEDLDENPSVLPASDTGNLREWKLSNTFSDEFDGSALDTDKWYDYHTYWFGRAPSAFETTNVRVEDGQLVLRSNYSDVLTPKMIEANTAMGGDDYKDFTAACVQSKQMTHYGYYEIKSRTAPISMTNAFWLQNNTAGIEIDVFEQIGRPKKDMDPNGGDIPSNTHYYPNGWGSDQSNHFNYKSGLDLTADFHVYGLEWDESFLRFYLDGELIREIPNVNFTAPQYLFFDTETFIWNGYPDPEDFKTIDGRFTGDYNIEYIRIWRSDVAQTTQPELEPPAKDVKGAKSVKGSPVITDGSGVVDPIWDSALEIGVLDVLEGEPEATGSVKTMWDEDYLYILANIADGDIYRSSANPNYNNDSFEVYVDSLNEKSDTGYDSNDFKVNVDYAGRFDLTANAPADTIKDVIHTPDGYIVQLAIPWVQVTPAAEVTVGFDVQINDASIEEESRIGYVKWNDTFNDIWSKMENSGNLTLVNQSKTPEQPSSSKSSGSGSGKQDTAIVAIPSAGLSVSRAVEEAKKAVLAAQSSGAGTAVARVKNVHAASLEALRAMANTAKMPLNLHADSMSEDGKSVEVRITIDPALAVKDLNLYGSVSNARAKTVKAHFEKWFANKIVIVSLEQSESFGQPAKIAAKVDLTGMNTEKLHFYSYNGKTNSYIRIADPRYWIDKNGYIHFTTELAGDIIISENALAAK